MNWFNKKSKEAKENELVPVIPEPTKQELKEEKQAQAQGKEKTKEKEDKENIQKVNTNQIKIVLYRAMSDSLVAQVGKPIFATEKKDANNNLIVINEDARFKEDFSFSVDRIFEVMNYTLDMNNKTKTEKREVLTKAIKIQEDLLLSIESDKEKNQTYNYPDEELKLNQLKIFRDSLKRETNGNYMRLGEGGIRQYEFVVIDGILTPYFFGSKWFRAYPDLQVKKKIFNHENSVFKMETAALSKNALNWMMIITLILGAVLCAIGAAMIGHAYSKNSEITTAANAGAITCNNVMATMVAQYGTGVTEYVDWKKQEIESIKKNKVVDNSIAKAGDIIINPSQITR